jgi:hypothetical protein
VARSHYSYEKRRKELEKQKKKEAKRAARAERKATGEQGGAPVLEVDEWGNAVEPESAVEHDVEADGESDPAAESDRKKDPGAAT